MFNSIFNALWPVKDVLDFIFNGVFDGLISEKTKALIDLNKLENDIKTKAYTTEILDLELSQEGVDKKINNFPFKLISGNISKMTIKFPQNFMKEKIIISLENINLHLENKNEIYFTDTDFINEEKKAQDKVKAALNKIINLAMNNVEITLKNIAVKFTLNNTKDKFLNILISKILYGKFQDNNKDDLFLFNKQISVFNFLVRIEDNEIDYIENNINDKFFQICDEFNEKELINFYTSKNCIMSVNNLNNDENNYNSLLLKFFKTNEKSSIKAESLINNVEFILTKVQFNFLMNIIYSMYNTKIVYENPKKTENLNSAHLEIFSILLNSIDINFSIKNFYFLILENTDLILTPKPKMWLMYENYYKKYYVSDENNNFSFNNVDNIQRHFIYFEDNYFIFNSSQINLSSVIKIKEQIFNFTTTVGDVSLRYVENNNLPIKKDLIVINNIISNEVEKYFDEKYSKMFINTIRYGFYSFGILDIYNNKKNAFELILDSKKESNSVNVQFNEINVDPNFFLMLKMYYLFLPNFINLSEKSEKTENIIQKVNANVEKIIKIKINLKLNIKISTIKNSHFMFKDFYNLNIHHLFSQGTNNSIKLKIGDNLSSEHLILKFGEININYDNCNCINLDFDINNFYIFYFLKDIYFPVLMFKNSSNKKTLIFSQKEFNNIDDYQTSFVNEMKYNINSHHIKNNENFIIDDIMNNSINFEAIKKCKIELINKFDLYFNKFDILINYTYLRHLVEFIQLIFYNSKFLEYFSKVMGWKFFNISENFKNVNNEEIVLKNNSVNLNIEEINIIGFSNLNLDLCNFENRNSLYSIDKNIEFKNINDLETFLQIPENIFNIIDNIFFKIVFSHLQSTLININLSNIETSNNYFIFTLDNFKILIRKNDSALDNKIKYQIFFQNIYEEENFDSFLYKGVSNLTHKTNLVSLLAKFDYTNTPPLSNAKCFSKLEPADLENFVYKYNIFIQKIPKANINCILIINDIVISPLFNSLEESIKLLEEIKKDYYKMKILMKNCKYELHNLFKNEINANKKLFDYKNNTLISSDYDIGIINDCSFNVVISRVVFDLYSFNPKKLKHDKIDSKYKMRLITEIEGVVIEDKRRVKVFDNSAPNSLNLKLAHINCIFLKNLDYQNSSLSLLNRCKNISKENSFWKNLGFCDIFHLENLNVLITQSINKTFNSEFTINSIEFSFCRDSFKYFIIFALKAKTDFIYLINLFHKAENFDMDSLITEFEMIQDKIFVNDNTKFLNNNNHIDNSIEIKKVNQKTKERKQSIELKLMKKNENLMVLDSNYDKRSKQSNERSKSAQREHFHSERENTIHNFKTENERCETLRDITMSQSERETYSLVNITEKLNLFFVIHHLKFYLFDGKDFKFIDKYCEKNPLSENGNGIASQVSNFSIIEDYIGNFRSQDNKKINKKLQNDKRDNRMQEITRNYSNSIQICFTNIEMKFLYYK